MARATREIQGQNVFLNQEEDRVKVKGLVSLHVVLAATLAQPRQKVVDFSPEKAS